MAAPPPRISSLDALRGVAVLGILVVNVQSYAFVAAARTNPTVQGDLHGANWWVWLVTYVLFDGKFIALFAILFGASIVLLADRCERRGIPPGPVHFRRMTILLGFGLLHAYVLWYGDWLATLAVTGGLAFLYRDLSAPRLLAAGVVVYAIGSITVPLIALWASTSAPDMVAQVAAEWRPSPEAVAWELARYRGGWLMQMEHRVPAAFRYETSYLAIRGLWQMTGLMLVGMALQKLDVLTARRPRAVYAAMLVGGLGIGIPAVLYGVSWSVTSDWSVETFRAITDPLNYWGGLIACAGWIGAVMLLARSGISLRGLEAVGRLALTNYLLQSVICTTIFYGHGLGLFGRVERVGQAGIVLAVWAVQIAGSVCWLRSFDFGPVEWVWRCVTYGRWMPLRRSAPAAGAS
jgi:uncharacterized protein